MDAQRKLVIALFNFEGAARRVKSPKRKHLERKPTSKTHKHGGVAQLGEHLLCKQGVRGSIPLISTKRGAHSSAG